MLLPFINSNRSLELRCKMIVESFIHDEWLVLQEKPTTNMSGLPFSNVYDVEFICITCRLIKIQAESRARWKLSVAKKCQNCLKYMHPKWQFWMSHLNLAHSTKNQQHENSCSQVSSQCMCLMMLVYQMWYTCFHFFSLFSLLSFSVSNYNLSMFWSIPAKRCRCISINMRDTNRMNEMNEWMIFFWFIVHLFFRLLSTISFFHFCFYFPFSALPFFSKWSQSFGFVLELKFNMKFYLRMLRVWVRLRLFLSIERKSIYIRL